MTPLPPDPSPAQAATTLPKIEQDTTPHINIDEVVTEDTIDDDYIEDIPPGEITHKDKDEDKEDEETRYINPPSPAEDWTWNSP